MFSFSQKPIAQLFLWLMIIGGITGGFKYYEVFKNKRYIKQIQSNAGKDSVVFKKQNDGHFYLPIQILLNKKNILFNNKMHSLNFLVDTGASRVMLSMNDAKKIGINVHRLNFNERFETANGVVYTANITIPYMKIGDLPPLENVTVNIPKSDMNISLFGIAAFKNFDILFSGPYMILRNPSDNGAFNNCFAK